MNDSEIVAAYTAVLLAHGASVDEVVATPEYREAFLLMAQEGLGPVCERDLLMRLLSLRKRSKLPRARDLTVPSDAA